MTAAEIGGRELTLRRLEAQLLDGERTARGPEDVARHLLAIQAQDARGARLAVRARSSGLTAADVDVCLGEERSLVIGWLNRGTLHMVGADDYSWLHSLTAHRSLNANERRLAEEGLDANAVERALAAIERALGAEGALVRAELAERLEAAGVRAQGQAVYHLLMRACLLGTCVRGPTRGGEQAYVLSADWLGEPSPVDRERALAELARRYLRGHAPARDRDLAYWAGITLGDARRGLQAIAAELEEPDPPGGTGDSPLLQLAGAAGASAGASSGSSSGSATGSSSGPPPGASPASSPPPTLLGPFDPLLHGWPDREPLLGEHGAKVVTRNGIFRASALVDARVVATWRIPSGRVELQPFAPLPADVGEALEREARDVERFLGAPQA